MDWKIVFSDIDGTLLNSQHEVSSKTVSAVKALAKKHIPFVLVSARMPKAIKLINDKMQVQMPIISYGGALVLDKQQKILHDEKLQGSAAKSIIEEIKQRWGDKVTVNYYSDDNWYVEDKQDKRVQREENITNVQAQPAEFEKLLADNILPNKLLCMSDEKVCEQMEKILKAKFDDLNIMRSSPILLEIMSKNVGKAKGIAVLLRHLNIDKKQAIAFGDNYNDMDMLDFVGTGVVMQNAPEDIKATAKQITKSNDDDGIYAYLKKVSLI